MIRRHIRRSRTSFGAGDVGGRRQRRRRRRPSGLVRAVATTIALLLFVPSSYTSPQSGVSTTTLAFMANDHHRPTRRSPMSIPMRVRHSQPQRLSLSLPSFTYGTARPSFPFDPALRMSSIGGGNMDNNNGDGDNDDENNPLNEWISRRDTENVRRAREQFAESRLPISYGAMKDDEDGQRRKRNGKFGPLQSDDGTSEKKDAIDASSTSSTSSGLTISERNPYLDVVSRLTPSDLISRFTSTASPRVQDAVRTTVLGLIGGLPQMAFETRTVATGERLASLMFQLQMTGYMFKNAEYRLSLSQSLGGGSGGSSSRMLPGGVGGDYDDDDVTAVREGKGRLRGKIKVRYGGAGNGNNDEESSAERKGYDDGGSDDREQPSTTTSPGMEVEVDAQAYMSELRGEVSRLRDELDATRQAKEEEIRKDLLMYIRTLPQQELQQLTGTMSPEVLEAMKGLVTAVLAGIGDDDEDANGGDAMAGNVVAEVNKIGPETVTEQSGEALAQLCMWQLVVGFNLRELEVREEFRASMKNMLGEGLSDGGGDGADGNGDGGVRFGPGTLE